MMWYQWDKKEGGRRWWKKWPGRSKQSYDVNAAQNDGLWDGDIRQFTNKSFEGYFSDISAIANRAIPPWSQCLEQNGDVPSASDMALAMTPRTAGTVEKVQKYLLQTESFEPQTENTSRSVDTYGFPLPDMNHALLSLKSEEDYGTPKRSTRCSIVEKFLVGTSTYLAIAVMIMLIVTVIMVATLSDINKSIQNINVDDSTKSVTSPLVVLTTTDVQKTFAMTTRQPDKTSFNSLTSTTTVPSTFSMTSKATIISLLSTKLTTNTIATTSSTSRITKTMNTTSTMKLPTTSTAPKQTTSLKTTESVILTTSKTTTNLPSSTTYTQSTILKPVTTTRQTPTSQIPTTKAKTTQSTVALTIPKQSTALTTSTSALKTTTTEAASPTTTTLSPSKITTRTPVTTVSPSATTIRTPVTTVTPSTTTIRTPVTTVTPSTTTTRTPVTTVSPITRTTRAPVTTISPITRTTRTPVTTVSPSTTTTRTPVTTVSPSTTTIRAPVTTVSPITRTTRAPVTTISPSTRTTRTPVTTVSPSTKTTRSPVTTVLPSVKTTRATVTTVTPSTRNTRTTQQSTTSVTTLSPSQTPAITTVQPSEVVLCTSSYCNSLGYNMVGFINNTAKQCDDFYNFACGKWIETRSQSIQSGSTDSWNRSVKQDEKNMFNKKFKELLEQPISENDQIYTRNLKQLYTSCLDYDSVYDELTVLAEIRDLLKPLEFDKNLTTAKSVEELQRVAMSTFGTSPLFRYDVVTHGTGEATYNILTLSPPSLFLRKEAYEGNIDNTIDGLDYLNTVPRIMDSIFGDNGGGSVDPRRKRDADVTDDTGDFSSIDSDSYLGLNIKRKLLQYDYYDYDDNQEGQSQSVYSIARDLTLKVFDLERRMYQIIPSTKQDSQPSTQLLPLTWIQLQYPNIDWASIFPDLDGDVQILIRHSDYFAGLDKIISESNKDVVKVYELFTVILRGIWKYLPFNKRFDLYVFTDTPIIQYDWNNCVNFTFDLLNSELHQGYAVKYSADITSASDILQAILTNITAIARSNITNSPNLSTETKASLENVLFSLKLVGIQEPSLDMSFELLPYTSFLLSATRCLKKKYKEDIGRVGTMVGFIESPWSSMTPLYNRRINNIEVPLGVSLRVHNNELLFPLLTTIGYEIAESVVKALYGDLDSAEKGLLWSAASSETLLDVWSCFDDQLSTSKNGSKFASTSDVMTGHGALQLIQQEFVRQLAEGLTEPYILPSVPATSDQLFFLHFTQHFCDVPLINADHANLQRINTVLKNNKFFQDTFHCVPGDNMYKENVCSS